MQGKQAKNPETKWGITQLALSELPQELEQQHNMITYYTSNSLGTLSDHFRIIPAMITQELLIPQKWWGVCYTGTV